MKDNTNKKQFPEIPESITGIQMYDIVENMCAVFRKKSRIQQAFILNTVLPRLFKQNKDQAELLGVWQEVKSLLERIHAGTLSEETKRVVKNISPAGLNPQTLKRIEKVASGLKTEYNISSAARMKDFRRICEDKNIEVLFNLTKFNYAFSFDHEGENFKTISLGRKKRTTLNKAFHLLGSLLIPALVNSKKKMNSDFLALVQARNFCQSQYFSELMRGAK